MTATTTASSHWPAPSAAAQRSAWHFGRVLEINGATVLQWVSRRNCSLAPRQVLGVYLSLCAISLLIAGVFTWLGALPVLAFAATELLLVGLAFLIYARHAADRETITLNGDALSVEHCYGSSVERADFRSAWVRVEPVHGEGSLLELSGEGQHVRVGRYLRPELRTPLARELRRALREQGPPAPQQES
jgi:uncharacterized membrane protein